MELKYIAIYIRTSTEEQNPENQIKDCERLADYGHYVLFKDKQSAWKDNKERSDFEKLKKEIKKGRIEKLIVWDLDRLYRNRTNLKGFFEFCKVNGCMIMSFRQKFLSEIQELQLPKGFEFIKEMMLDQFIHFLGWIAEDESKKKSDRVKLAVRKKGKKTISYKGNKWGRKSLSTQKLNKIRKLQHLSVRKISEEIGISKSAVHKYLTMIKEKKTSK